MLFGCMSPGKESSLTKGKSITLISRYSGKSYRNVTSSVFMYYLTHIKIYLIGNSVGKGFLIGLYKELISHSLCKSKWTTTNMEIPIERNV